MYLNNIQYVYTHNALAHLYTYRCESMGYSPYVKNDTLILQFQIIGHCGMGLVIEEGHY